MPNHTLDPQDWSLGIPPLSSFQGTTTPVSPSVQQPRVAPQVNDDANREFLAQILLGIGEMGGQKSPSFMKDILRDRALTRRLTAGQQAIADRQALNAQRIQDRQIAAEERKTAREEAKTEKTSEAISDVFKEAQNTAFHEITQQIMHGWQARMASAGVPIETQEKILKRIGLSYKLSKDESSWMVLDAATGKPWNIEIPREIVDQVAGTLVKRKGTQVGETFVPPSRTTLGPGQQSVPVPGEMAPAPSTVPVPSSGLPKTGVIQPTSGMQLTQGGLPERQTIAGPQAETPLTPAERTLLAGTPYAKIRTFEELDRQGGGPTLQAAVRGEEDRKRSAAADEADRRMRAMTEEIEVREEKRREAAARQKENAPVNENIGWWWNPKTRTQATNANMSPAELKEAGFTSVKNPKIVQTLVSANNIERDLKDAFKIAARNPGWFPRETGFGPLDAALMATGARRRGWSTKEDAAAFAAKVGNLAGYARASGDDRISNMDTELQMLATGLGPAGMLYGGSNTLEQLAARFNSVLSRVDQSVKTHGFRGVDPVKATKRGVSGPGTALPGGRRSEDRAFGDKP